MQAQSGAVMVAGRNHRALQCDSMSIDAMSWIGGHAPSAVEAGRELPLMVQYVNCFVRVICTTLTHERVPQMSASGRAVALHSVAGAGNEWIQRGVTLRGPRCARGAWPDGGHLRWQRVSGRWAGG